MSSPARMNKSDPLSRTDTWPETPELQSGVVLSEQIYGYVRSAIVAGIVEPGMSVLEPDLAKRFGVSRTPVREALLRLRDDGLVIIKRQSGIIIAPIDKNRVEEAMIVREALEPRMAAMAAERISQRTVLDLEFETDRMSAAIEPHDHRAFIEADNMFHRLLINASGFMHIVQITEQVSGQLDRIRYLSVAEPIRAAAAIQEHRTLIKHLQDGDAAACEQMVRQHLQESWVLIRELLDR